LSTERRIKWDIRYAKKFPDYLERLDSRSLSRFDDLVRELTHNPRRLGIPKQTKKHGICYITDIDKSNRLAYRIYNKSHIVELVIVGDHKEVYGKG
jgi:mRNA-degrading endonuclease RelE of RelBE toxin-antitoxin system